jgi:lipid II:glycine glycyltransferase (peptidoglycan interpeptide bridge formation enzyme)
LVRVVGGAGGVQILFRALPLGFSLGYIPKGPLGANWEQLWPEIDTLCRARRAVFLKVEPDAWEDEFDQQRQFSAFGFQPSDHSLQPRRTAIVDISGEEEEILARMKQKTRYNIRLAGRKEVVVTPSSDLEAFSSLMDVTGQRDEFGVHSRSYYRRVYELFHPLGMCELLVASYQGQPLAGIMVFARGDRAWYLYGASNNLERNRMPAYLVQWEAIRWARRKGCTSYDLWGVPDADEETLEADFTQRSDGLWGVYRFKRGFGGQIRRAAGAWDKVYNRTAYLAYQLLIARRGTD